MYSNPNQLCAPANPATYYDSQRLADTFTIVLPPIREWLSSNAQALAKESPPNPEIIKPIVATPTVGFTLMNQPLEQLNLRVLDVGSACQT